MLLPKAMLVVRTDVELVGVGHDAAGYNMLLDLAVLVTMDDS